MTTTQRYLALDVFRGITIASMILVNNPGSWAHIYPPLRHSEWHGCTPTDLVFPFFLFIVGVSMVFSFARYNTTLNKQSLLRIGRRTLLIFAIGLFLNSFPQWSVDFSKLRIMGVLQRIALAYGMGAVIVLAVPRRFLLTVTMIILLAYWWILYHFGGADPYSLNSNATIPFDSSILGTRHLYKGFGIPFDPEGLLSTIPAIGTVILGFMAGLIIRHTERSSAPLKLLIWGVIGIAAGLVWNFILPVNKPLWTSSYVLYTAGLASLTIALLIWVIDLKGYSGWTSFFKVFGMNSLFIFALSGLWAKTLTRLIKITGPDGSVINGYSWVYRHLFLPWAGELNGSLLFALAHIFIFWLICLILYKKKVFIKV